MLPFLGRKPESIRPENPEQIWRETTEYRRRMFTMLLAGLEFARNHRNPGSNLLIGTLQKYKLAQLILHPRDIHDPNLLITSNQVTGEISLRMIRLPETNQMDPPHTLVRDNNSLLFIQGGFTEKTQLGYLDKGTFNMKETNLWTANLSKQELGFPREWEGSVIDTLNKKVAIAEGYMKASQVRAFYALDIHYVEDGDSQRTSWFTFAPPGRLGFEP